MDSALGAVIPSDCMLLSTWYRDSARLFGDWPTCPASFRTPSDKVPSWFLLTPACVFSVVIWALNFSA